MPAFEAWCDLMRFRISSLGIYQPPSPAISETWRFDNAGYPAVLIRGYMAEGTIRSALSQLRTHGSMIQHYWDPEGVR